MVLSTLVFRVYDKSQYIRPFQGSVLTLENTGTTIDFLFFLTCGTSGFSKVKRIRMQCYSYVDNIVMFKTVRKCQ